MGTETRTEQQCSSRPVQECQAVPRPVTEEVCTPAQEPECHNVVDVIQEQQCHQEQQCRDEVTTIVDTTTIEDCQDITEQVCTQSSVSVAHSSNVVGRTSGVAGVAVAPAAVGVAGVAGGVQAVGYGAGLINHHIGKREAEADADAFYGAGYAAAPVAAAGGYSSAPNCHAETKRVCNPRSVQTPRQISNPVCVSVPICNSIPREVPRTVCGTRPPVRSAPLSLTRSQGLPVLRSLSLLRPLLPTLQLLSLPPLWPLLVTELALVLVSVPLVATLPESLVLVLSATVPVLVLSATELAL